MTNNLCKRKIFRIAHVITMLAILSLACGANAVPEPAGEAATVNFESSDAPSNLSLDTEEQAFLVLINNYRVQNGQKALSTDALLQAGANWMSNDMLTGCVAGKYACSHEDSTGRSFGKRLQDFGYPAGVTAAAGENIAWGYNGGITTAQQAFNGWRNSPGHNTNMLKGTYVAIGISRSCNSGNCAWVTDFGSQIVSVSLTGDLNGNAISADAGDLVLIKRASIGETRAGSGYDLNNDGQFADAGDLVLMKRASIGEIVFK